MLSFEKPLEGKVAVVTGAGRGIGKAIALGYAGAGASVVCAARTVQEIERTVEEIGKSGGTAAAVPADVTCAGSVDGLFAQAMERFGRVDIVVINAGGNYDRETVENGSPNKWRKTVEVLRRQKCGAGRGPMPGQFQMRFW